MKRGNQGKNRKKNADEKISHLAQAYKKIL